MTFLTRTPGMTKKEAQEVLDLYELVRYSLEVGPVPLDYFADRIRHVKSDDVLSKERHARRLVARLKALGFNVVTQGDVKEGDDASKMTLDFGQDEALRGAVEREVDAATAKLSADEDDEGNVSRQVTDENDGEVAPVDSIKIDHEIGLAVRHLCRRYKITPRRMLSLLRALRVEANEEGRPSLEQSRTIAVLQEASDPAVEEMRKHKHGKRKCNRVDCGRVSAAARILGCHRDTARAFLKRFDEVQRG